MSDKRPAPPAAKPDAARKGAAPCVLVLAVGPKP